MPKRKKSKRLSRSKNPVLTHIRPFLRRAMMYWPARNEARKRAKAGRNVWLCNMCGGYADKVIVDHIEPVIDPHTGFVDWNQYIARGFPAVEGFQVLCYECSDAKTTIENQIRKITKKRLASKKPS